MRLMMEGEETQEELIPRESDEQDAIASLTTSQLLLRFPDLAPPVGVPEECRKMDEEKRYNGRHYERDNPEACKWVVKCLAAGLGWREIIRMGGPGYYVMKAIGHNHQLDVAKEKRHLASLNFIGSEIYAERAMQLAGTMKSGKDAAISSGIFTDKALLFAGDATQRIEIKATVDFRVELQRLNAEVMEKLEEMKRAEIIEIEPVVEAPAA
jgi:hypothetical protein